MPTSRHLVSAPAAAWAAAFVLLMAGHAAHAQLTPFFGNQGPYLNRTDFDMADAAARHLLEPQPAAKGTVANWTNPASGNSGALTMGRAYQKNGNDCRTVSWHDVYKAGANRTVSLDTCRVAGVWRLM